MIIYFAGHGELVEDKAFWLPIDAQADNVANWIIVDTITNMLKRLEARHVLVVADSCYSGAFRKARSSGSSISSDQLFYIKKLRE